MGQPQGGDSRARVHIVESLWAQRPANTANRSILQRKVVIPECLHECVDCGKAHHVQSFALLGCRLWSGKPCRHTFDNLSPSASEEAGEPDPKAGPIRVKREKMTAASPLQLVF